MFNSHITKRLPLFTTLLTAALSINSIAAEPKAASVQELFEAPKITKNPVTIFVAKKLITM